MAAEAAGPSGGTMTLVPVNCPSCRGPMEAHTLEGRLGRPVAIDLCLGCQAFWFDGRESLQLTPGATLALFRIVGEHASRRRGPLSEGTACPRCGAGLLLTHDRQRNTVFQYRRCPQTHGRLTTFYDFLREKDFIRPLSREQIEELRRNVQAVNCSNCGASVDLTTGAACAHCGSALSMLDMKQAEELITRLQEADREGRTIDPALPLRLAQARREVETAFAAFEREPTWFQEVSATDLVGAGLGALARWLKDGR